MLALAAPAAVASAEPAPGRADFDTTAFRMVEATYPVVMTVTRPGGLDAGPATVDYATVSHTALANEDFRPVRGTLIFGVGDRTKTFVVPILDDNRDESDEELMVVLSNPRGSFSASGEPALVTIEDDDDPAPAVATAPPAAPKPAAAVAAPPTTVAAAPRSAATQQVATRRRTATRTVRQARPTTLELQQPGLADAPGSRTRPTEIDGGLVLVAALLLGRVAAGAWFERRLLLLSLRRSPALHSRGVPASRPW